MNTYEYIIKKYNLNIGNQYIVEIPNMGRDDLAKLFAELKFTKGAEIGVWEGEYSEVLCKANSKLHLYAIDAWKLSSYESEEQKTALIAPQSYFDTKYRVAVNRLAPYNCTIVRKTSMEALKDFKDNSLDFVYIDANHDFPNFVNDLHYWLKKVREDGIISGHDYANFSYKKFNHVKRALVPYARCYRMQPLFIVGAQEYDSKDVPSPGRDKYRSWFWVKKKGGLR